MCLALILRECHLLEVHEAAWELLCQVGESMVGHQRRGGATRDLPAAGLSPGVQAVHERGGGVGCNLRWGGKVVREDG